MKAFVEMASAGVKVNIALFAFHLIPILPMAGGQVIFSLLPSGRLISSLKLNRMDFLSYWAWRFCIVAVLDAATDAHTNRSVKSVVVAFACDFRLSLLW
jgi:Zn-dependent protease